MILRYFIISSNYCLLLSTWYCWRRWVFPKAWWKQFMTMKCLFEYFFNHLSFLLILLFLSLLTLTFRINYAWFWTSQMTINFPIKSLSLLLIKVILLRHVSNALQKYKHSNRYLALINHKRYSKCFGLNHFNKSI